MKKFMDDDFLLDTKTAQHLYHEYAEAMPIMDYHCHVSPREIAEDRRFDNITQVWLGGDHYKWRLMRSCGVDERFITGDASDRDKFMKWAESLERAIGNPLYHWSHLELQRYFGYTAALGARTADEVWELCNKRLADPDMSVRGIIRQSNVTLICTTDDPADDLRWHKAIREDTSFTTKVLPAWRPDKVMKIDSPEYPADMRRLGEVAGVEIKGFDSMIQALSVRMDYFDTYGCKASDHSFDFAMYAPADAATVDGIVHRALAGGSVSFEDKQKFLTRFIIEMAALYKEHGWVMQLHYGALRDNNKLMYGRIGADTGFDCINPNTPTASLAALLGAMGEHLPKTVIYSLNPIDNAAIGSIIGCFQGTEARGKIQQGSAWWFNDNKQGMIDQMTSLANLGCLGNFIGMLTDSRSFLSYTRHHYFRRILCNLIGGWVENGEYPDDDEMLKTLVQGISYDNAMAYFGFL